MVTADDFSRRREDPSDALSTGIVERADALLAEISGRRPPTDGSAAGELPIVTSPLLSKPRDVLEIPIRLANEGARSLVVGLAGTDLINAAGDRIPSSCLSFRGGDQPVGPGVRLPVTVVVAIPPHCAAGSYWGLIQVVGQPDARALLSVKVG